MDTSQQQQSPTAKGVDKEYILYTIPFSHYCLIGRWALKLSGKRFKEVGYIPGAHLVFGPQERLRKSSSRDDGERRPSALPLLTDREGNVVGNDSWECLSVIDSLSGNESVDPELQDILDNIVGPHTRSLTYYYMLKGSKEADQAFLKTCLSKPEVTTFLQRVLIRIPFIRRELAKAMEISMVKDEAYIEKCRNELKEAFEKLKRVIIVDKKNQFSLDRATPTSSIIAVASLCSPLVLPEEVNAIPFEEYPKGLQEEVKTWRTTFVGEWVSKVFHKFSASFTI